MGRGKSLSERVKGHSYPELGVKAKWQPNVFEKYRHTKRGKRWLKQRNQAEAMSLILLCPGAGASSVGVPTVKRGRKNQSS